MTASEHDEIELPQVVNLSQVNVDEVHAELVRASHAAIRRLEAEEADVNGIIIGSAVTGKLNGRQVAIGALNAKHVELREAFIGGVRGESISVSGNTAMMAATTIESPEVRAVIVAGAEINAANIRTGLLVGRKINGNVHTLLDTRTAILAGVFGGLVTGLVMLAGKLLFGKKK
jgi:hypothetical protein